MRFPERKEDYRIIRRYIAETVALNDGLKRDTPEFEVRVVDILSDPKHIKTIDKSIDARLGYFEEIKEAV